MSIGLHILLTFSIICFLKGSIIQDMKVVPNDNFKLGGERVKIKNKNVRRVPNILTESQKTHACKTIRELDSIF